MNEIQSPEKSQSFLKERIKELDNWDFEKKPPFSTVNFLSGLLEDIKTNHPSSIIISENLLSEEIKRELEKPYGRMIISMGKWPEWVLKAEDRGLSVIEIQAKCPMDENDIWGLRFTLDPSAPIRVEDTSVSGPNSIHMVRFPEKYEYENKTLINIVAKLTRAALTQITSPNS